MPALSRLTRQNPATRVVILLRFCLSIVLIPLFATQTVEAKPSIHDRYAKACLKEAAKQERLNSLPKGLMGAIGLTESGRQSKEGLKVPWPWTVNVEGEGHRFDTKQEAMHAVRIWMKQGKTSIDVGCFQVNLKWHPDAFDSLNQAFDPRRSAEYAAKFLRELRKELGGWDRAMRAWHSRDPKKGKRYGKMVMANRKLLRQQQRQMRRMSLAK